jgi:type II secretory pathway predicted ATPase ExeA
MRVYDRRLQILLDELRYRRVAAIARERKTSMAAVVREAIDLLHPHERAKKRAAAKAILEAEPMTVPELEKLKAELEEVRSGGL